MLVPPFEMHVAKSVEDAISLRAEFGDDASFYCGGTELVLVMKLGLTDLAHLIDIKRVDELRTISIDDLGIRIGAAVTYREIENNPLLVADRPEFVSMISGIANIRVRSVGTLGGNLAFADPSSDPATYLLAVGGELEIGSADGERRIVPMDGFHTGPYQPDMRDNEMIVSVRLPRNVTGGVVVHERMKLKERPNITVAVRAAAVKGKVTQARVAVGSVGLVPVRFDEVDATLVGIEASTLDERLARAATLASESISLFDDANGSVEYKRHLVDHFVQKVARKAIEAVV
jgi:carbon-monoxide dehydrogenase medium subunit